ncbi:coiled-coil domain-containing protein 30 isoform X4 [Genypterus blacodes]|uniref:coiled-coil domain-containing protein 30 isoform X4 n=1 Tax=Genypterus blacodes TaxID=154954 RepID=UPI003F762ED1
MDQPKEEFEQIATWLREEGLAPEAAEEAQLCFLWRALQHTRSRLLSATGNLDSQRSQHIAEMTEVQKSLEQIRIFTEHKDVLALEIQDENDQLKDQLRRLISLQDAQISEVAKMLYQQGLTELIHSSPSEQVAYLLVERASLLEKRDNPDNLAGHEDTGGPLAAKTAGPNDNMHQSPHKGAPRHVQSPWKKLFGLHKAAQSKRTFIPTEARHLAGHAGSVQRECSRLERDLEEGSRRLAMAHNEIRRLTDELESAHLTQRAYEPEMQAAQQEVEQLRQEVEKLKKCEMVEHRKAKDLNDRLDVEIRALRNRVRTLDAEKSSLHQTVVLLQKEVDQLRSALQEQQQELQATELTEEVDQLRSALQEQQQELQTVQVQADQATELTGSQATELVHSKQTCRDLQQQLSAQTRCLSLKEAELQSLKKQLDASHSDLDDLRATICNNTITLQGQKLWQQRDTQHCENTQCKHEESFSPKDQQEQLQHNNTTTQQTACSDHQEALKALQATRDECETLKEEICETLKCLDKEKSKSHEMKEKHKAKQCRVKRKLDDETKWRDEKMKNLERELSLSVHSLAKEKELVVSITVENEKLLFERRKLLQHLNEEEHNKKDRNLTASLARCRVDFLEMENKKLGNKILHLSNQLSVLERSLQNLHSLHFAEELKRVSKLQQAFLTSPDSRGTMPEPCDIQDVMDTRTKQADVLSPPRRPISVSLARPAEMGYLNLTSTLGRSDHSATTGPLTGRDDVST